MMHWQINFVSGKGLKVMIDFNVSVITVIFLRKIRFIYRMPDCSTLSLLDRSSSSYFANPYNTLRAVSSTV